MSVPVHESKVTNAQSGVEPQAYFEGASVDPTDARKPTVRRFGRSDRSNLGRSIKRALTSRFVRLTTGGRRFGAAEMGTAIRGSWPETFPKMADPLTSDPEPYSPLSGFFRSRMARVGFRPRSVHASPSTRER